MTRKEVLEEILKIPNNNIVLELPTGFGKTRSALELAKKWNTKTLLIVVSRVVHKSNWEDEINKWWPNNQATITMTTYYSLHKYAGEYDTVILDEAHHTTERSIELLQGYSFKHAVMLSATINKETKWALGTLFPNLYVYKKTLRDAIDDEILPDPTIYLYPLQLDNTKRTEEIWFNKNLKGTPITLEFKYKWYYKKYNRPVKIVCTPCQYYNDLNSKIEFYKNKFMICRSEIIKNKWLHLCSERLTWLASKKLSVVKTLLKKYENSRTLTFCNNIEHTEILGKYCINSKNKDAIKNLEDFNAGKINHITACNMLNESVNLVNCQIGIYGNLNSSEIIVKQRIGRLLRHKNPIIIIPYFKNTRDEELVNKMKEDYNEELIHVMQ